MTRQDFPVERAALARLLSTLLPEHEGEFVVLFGNELVAITKTLEAAFEKGFRRVNGPRFFAARLSATEEAVRMPAELLWAVAEA